MVQAIKMFLWGLATLAVIVWFWMLAIMAGGLGMTDLQAIIFFVLPIIMIGVLLEKLIINSIK